MIRHSGRNLSFISLLLLSILLTGCAMVEVKSVDPRQYLAMKRGDILSAGQLGAMTQETLRIVGIKDTSCRQSANECHNALEKAAGIAEERRLAALAELWMQHALDLTAQQTNKYSDAAIAAYFETARYAYAYLFFSHRAAGQRAFEDQQTQVRDYYNYAVQQAVTMLFHRHQTTERVQIIQLQDWIFTSDMSHIKIDWGNFLPQEVLAAQSLRFSGIRNVYRQDGIGAELVAVKKNAAPQIIPSSKDSKRKGFLAPSVFSEMPSPSLTALLHFPGANLKDILTTRQVWLAGYDPYTKTTIDINGHTAPLAANYTAGYGLWLARSGFARQSLDTLLGREQGISQVHLYLMQPYDPDKRIILMLHGLASSPEAWVNVANEILGDETLRQHFQVWQLYYPTNMPIIVNHAAIRRAFDDTLHHFDPDGRAAASRNVVLIGHSMGGVLSRLMLSSSENRLWSWMSEQENVDEKQLDQVRDRLQPLLSFEPVSAIGRAVFIAAPHRGTSAAERRLGRWASSLIRLPLTILESVDDILHTMGNTDKQVSKRFYLPNSIDQLRETDPFIQVSMTLPMADDVPYHSIIAQRNAKVSLEDSDDGLVPYRSSHLENALSEKVIISDHSVQETPQAILEIRRILHEDLAAGSGIPSFFNRFLF